MLENRESFEQGTSSFQYSVVVEVTTEGGQFSITEVAHSNRFKEARGLWKQHRNSSAEMLLKHFEEPEYVYEWIESGETDFTFIIKEGDKLVYSLRTYLSQGQPRHQK